MKNFTLHTIFCVALLGFCSLLSAQDNESSIDFETDIKPILESNCLRCHKEGEAEGGYQMDNRDDAMDYVEEGDAESSDFYLYLISDDEEELMPPADDGGPLDDSDIKLIKTWINEGASWPEGLALADPADEAPVEAEKPTVYFAIGLLHPATLHLPIGLLFGAGLFALLSIRGNFVMSDCAYYCLWLGTFGAIIACVTGWWFVLDRHSGEYVSADKLVEGLKDGSHKLFWHRTSALIVTGFALLLSLYAASARNRDPDDGVSWKLGAILLAAGIGYVGHEGGELSWKESHYDELWEVVDEYIPGVVGIDGSDDEGGGETVEDESDEEDDELVVEGDITT